MRILALDQSTRVSGWAIFTDGRLNDYGKFDVSKIYDLGDRLHEIRQTVEHIIDDEHIDAVILEDIYMDGQRVNNVQTFKALAEVFGVLYELCIDMKVPVQAVLAGTWKSALGIKGKTRPEQKRAAQVWVEEHYGIKPTQDEVDAICIGAHISEPNENEWGE